MKIQFYVDLDSNKLKVEASFSREEMIKSQFLLNRDFIIDELICDSSNIDIEKIKSQVLVEDYLVNQYILPENSKYITMKYTGVLDGTTGFCPYVREKISKDFSFFRWETFYYPIFASTDFQDILRVINTIEGEIDVIVPKGYSVLSTSQLLKEEYIDDKVVYKFYGNSMNFAIAQYERIQLPVGDFYLFNNGLAPQTIEMVTSTLTGAHKFMNENFGERLISSEVKYVSIPHRFGSFARPTCVYIDEQTFSSQRNMQGIIHEFIHLGWNAVTDDKTQRIRFFDEAFTNYFTLRVVEHMLSHDDYIKTLNSYKTSHRERFSKNLVPIVDYGKHECGDFSYTIGALCLHELCQLVGKETFDNATRLFLEKYRYAPVTIDEFCNEYIMLCKAPDLKNFFEDWIYTTKGPERCLNI